MTIRRRLTVSFLIILVLFAFNLLVYFWGNQKRQATVESLRRAIARQTLIASINQSLNDASKQVGLISQVAADLGGGGLNESEIAKFDTQLESIRRQISDLLQLEAPSDRSAVEKFQQAMARLSDSWRIFYRSLGPDQATAITELAVRADPISQMLLLDQLPKLQARELDGVEAASRNFYEAAHLTDRITIGIFLVSTLVALGIAFRVSHYLTRGLTQLKEGASAVGSLRLDERIQLDSRDELGDLARAFNEMSRRLAVAKDDLVAANEQERRKSEELSAALDQLRIAQDQLLVQQKLASLGSLTAGIAHEIKNPLNFVTNFSELSGELTTELKEIVEKNADRLERHDREDLLDLLDNLQQNVSKIREHGKRADSIVRGMLMHSRGTAGTVQPTDINTLASEYVKLAYHGMRAQDANFNVSISENYDPSLTPVNVVPQDLSRVLLNIVQNACYAATHRKDGTGRPPEISVTTKNLADKVEIRIRDNGDGVPPAIRAKIFEPFFSTKPAGAGTGLGLSLSYDIVVQAHKGELLLESVEGQYAEFIVRLPKT